MPATRTPCVDCGQDLSPITNTTWQCTNPVCPGGRHHYLCGFCRSPGFSLAKRMCTKKSCKTFGMVREPCKACHNFSVVTINGETFCVNRRCPSVADRLSDCDSCQTPSLIHMDRFSICVKSNCPMLMVPRPQAEADTAMEVPSEEPQHSAVDRVAMRMPTTDRRVPQERDQKEIPKDRLVTPQASLRTPPPIPVTPRGVTPPPADAPPDLKAAPTPTVIQDKAKPPEDDPWGFSRPMPAVEAPRQPLRPPPTDREDERTITDPMPVVKAPEPVKTPDPVKAKTPPPVQERQTTPPPVPDVADAKPVPVAQTPPVKPPDLPAVQTPAAQTPAPQTPAVSPPIQLVPPQPVATPEPGRPRPAVEHNTAMLMATSDIERAYNFIMNHVLAAPDQPLAPIVLVFGLAGSGKSTYLTMLGEILANGAGKYHFPYPGVNVRAVQVDRLIDERLGVDTSTRDRELLRRRIRDLCYDYAEKYYNEYLVNGAWAPATVRETGNAGEASAAHSYFLMSDLIRDGATFGRLVTIETSGEDYQEVLRKLGTVRSVNELSSPLHRVLYRLIDAATGIIVLLDPGSHDNDQNYASFLRIIKEEIEGRAAHALARLIDAKTTADLAEAAAKRPSLDSALEDEDNRRRKEERQTRIRGTFIEALRLLDETLRATPMTHEGVASLAAQHKTFLDQLEAIIVQVSPEFAAGAELKFQQHGRTATNYLQYYRGLMIKLAQKDIFEAAVALRARMEETQERQADAVIARILAERGLKERMHEAFVKRWAGRPAGRRLEHLRYLSMVVTKSDRYPIVYPPSDYPKFKLPTCSTHLATLESYLGILGGEVRYYNATSIGYAIQRGNQYGPGPGNSFTPVNIVEPLFDILLDEAAQKKAGAVDAGAVKPGPGKQP